jgi:hypothetical protein
MVYGALIGLGLGHVFNYCASLRKIQENCFNNYKNTNWEEHGVYIITRGTRCVCMCVCMSERERDRERYRVRGTGYVCMIKKTQCVCVWEKDTTRNIVCVCVCVCVCVRANSVERYYLDTTAATRTISFHLQQILGSPPSYTREECNFNVSGAALVLPSST